MVEVKLAQVVPLLIIGSITVSSLMIQTIPQGIPVIVVPMALHLDTLMGEEGGIILTH